MDNLISKPVAKKSRTSFSDSDFQILIQCVKKHQNVLENKKTNGITPAMKKKVSILI
jgi:Myb/SANT-like DNA-binding domain